MGGSISMTIRMPNGTVHKMLRWTNILPWALTNLSLINKDPAHLTAIMESWLEMRDDYEQNKSTGQFKLNMTDVYFPDSGLAPDGYGLVVVDLVKNVILTSQGYTWIGGIYWRHTFKEFWEGLVNLCEPVKELNVFLATTKPIDYDDALVFAALAQAGRVKKFSKYDSKLKEFSDTLLEGVSLAELMTSEKFSHGRGFTIDMSPLIVENFEETSAGFTHLKKRILDLGFEISAEEEETWSEWIKNLRADEEEDSE